MYARYIWYKTKNDFMYVFYKILPILCFKNRLPGFRYWNTTINTFFCFFVIRSKIDVLTVF